MESVPVHQPTTIQRSCEPGIRVTRSLLGYGVLAGPFYVAVALAQALLRPGFDLARHDVSLLANGDLGWIQVANFIATGAMVIACAEGMARALVIGPGAMAAPRLVAGFGVGLVAAGLFTADPMNGFPAGAPAGVPASITAHGLLHIVGGGVGFLCLISACIVMSRRFARHGDRRWAAFSAITGLAFLAGFAGLASGSSSPAVVLGFWAALLLAWAWLAAISVRLYRHAGNGPAA